MDQDTFTGIWFYVILGIIGLIFWGLKKIVWAMISESKKSNYDDLPIKELQNLRNSFKKEKLFWPIQRVWLEVLLRKTFITSNGFDYNYRFLLEQYVIYLAGLKDFLEKHWNEGFWSFWGEKNPIEITSASSSTEATHLSDLNDVLDWMKSIVDEHNELSDELIKTNSEKHWDTTIYDHEITSPTVYAYSQAQRGIGLKLKCSPKILAEEIEHIKTFHDSTDTFDIIDPNLEELNAEKRQRKAKRGEEYCPKCNGIVSSNAIACIHCGARF